MTMNEELKKARKAFDAEALEKWCKMFSKFTIVKLRSL